MTIKDYFDIRELVCRHIYNKFGDGAWQFFDNSLLETLLVIREKLDKPITVNNWHIGGEFTQRGLRCNVCSLVSRQTKIENVYMSAHMQGTGIDFDVKGMSANAVREWLKYNQVLLPYPIRLEEGVSWVHLDLRNDGSKGKIISFKG